MILRLISRKSYLSKVVSKITEKYKRKVKCPKCKQDIDRNVEPFEKKSGRYYHKQCIEQHKKEVEPRKELIDYICELYGIKVPTGYMLKQIKKFEEEPYNFKPKGMQLALYYFHHIKQNPIIEGVGIGIIEYVYQDARTYFETLADVQHHNSKVEIDTEEKVVTVNKRYRSKRKTKQIDLSNI